MPTSGIPVPPSILEEWVQNFRNNKDLGFLTENATISLQQLENFITEAKQKYFSDFNALKIYFIRYAVKASNNNIEKEDSKDISKPSLVLVPFKNNDSQTWRGEDLITDETIFLLPFCNPENPSNNVDETGLCPPKCGRGSTSPGK